MHVTIHDEGTRRVMLSAIWKDAADEVGDHFHDRLLNEFEAAIGLTTILRQTARALPSRAPIAVGIK